MLASVLKDNLESSILLLVNGSVFKLGLIFLVPVLILSDYFTFTLVYLGDAIFPASYSFALVTFGISD